MFHLKKNNARDIFKLHLMPHVTLALLMLSGGALVSAAGRIKPSRHDFAKSELTATQKEKFLDEHNKFRGMVDPPAADMEYLFWDEDLAKLAQMWSNQCVWDHGFLEFGDEYPNTVPFKGQVGQNLAREWGKLQNPEDRVIRWYKEHEFFKYSKFASPLTAAQCSKKPCGHYTQLAWATTRYLGCGVKWCDKEFGQPHPWIPGETIVTCDYGPTGNVIGQYPYKVGAPCSKCASGKGFCYKKLCRDCDNFDSECGKRLTQAMCSSSRELMAKKCPKMCNLCECPLKCQHGGTVILQNCVCSCSSGWKGTDCSEKVCPPGFYGENCENRWYDAAGKDTCEWRVRNGHSCKLHYMKVDWAATCGYCDEGSKVPTTPPTVTTAPASTASKPKCNTDLNSQCEVWAGRGECEKNPQWMSQNCCVSCTHHKAPKDCTDVSPSCPLWAILGECEFNRSWMLQNCRKSCNQCGDCEDTDAKCPSWALLKQCKSGGRISWMNTNCRKSCGLCRVYDKHEECPAWFAMEECKKSNWTWMVDHCPRSCNIPFSEASFCGGKENGNYQAPTTCQAYIACSHGVTSHVQCPSGKKFDKVKRICEQEAQATCSVVCPESFLN
ncbi:multiple epidermal growth factor-like domains protein 6 isoform X1 [Stylophora pistillata]|uniref:multiple epidermal growth factor-like domains protein 6 isoform X1 n=3 Tax=Stylophora pistillata TaxID=50429 RepID=UPI000C052025|nr:multiple epidermal growth factor-like domains protein 6 isoform X1 [Stylophora pistillata]